MALPTLPDDFDYGFDLSAETPGDFAELPAVTPLPPAAWVNLDFVPPPGDQGACPSCCSWASVYGLASFKAGKDGGYKPDKLKLQASPGYVYIMVMQAMNMTPGSCHGSGFADYFTILNAEGAPTMEDAPYPLIPGVVSPADSSDLKPVQAEVSQCEEIWNLYAHGKPKLNPAFKIKESIKISTRVLENIKQVLAAGHPVAYGTSLYTDFKTYDGKTVPYVGNGKIWMNNKTGKPVGHCMMILGYDDNCNNTGTGAFLIQNSQGDEWGEKGRVWMSYLTFEILAQGSGHYFP